MNTLIVLNNYFHDLLTGLFLACVIVSFMAFRTLDKINNSEILYFKRIYRMFKKTILISILLVIATGVIRAVFLNQLEPFYTEELKKTLVVKHVIIFLSLAVGVLLWVVFERKLKRIENENE